MCPYALVRLCPLFLVLNFVFIVYYPLNATMSYALALLW